MFLPEIRALGENAFIHCSRTTAIHVYLNSLLLSNGERTGLVVRASDSGLGDPGSILGRVGVLFP